MSPIFVVEELSELILELISNTDKRDSLGLTGYQMVMDELNSKHMSKKTLTVYKTIKNSKN